MKKAWTYVLESKKRDSLTWHQESFHAGKLEAMASLATASLDTKKEYRVTRMVVKR